MGKSCIEMEISGKICPNHFELLNERKPEIISAKHLRLHINSPGGDGNAAIKIVGLLYELRMDHWVMLETHGEQYVASAGLLVYFQAMRSLRTLDPECKVIIDLPYKAVEKGILLGYAETGRFLDSLHKENEILIAARSEWAQIFADHTKLSVDEIIKYDRSDQEISAEEALNYNFCSKLVKSAVKV